MEKWIYFFLFLDFSSSILCLLLEKGEVIVDLLVQIGKFEMEWQMHKASNESYLIKIQLI